MKFTYLWVDLFTVIIPFFFSFHPKLNFHKSFRYFFPANVLAAILFLSWDMLFTKIEVWGFNPDYISGIVKSSAGGGSVLSLRSIFLCLFLLLPESVFQNSMEAENGIYFRYWIFSDTTYYRNNILLSLIHFCNIYKPCTHAFIP